MSGSSPAAEGTSEEADLHRRGAQQHGNDSGRYSSAASSLQQQQLAGIPTSISQASTSLVPGAASVAASASSHHSVVPGLMRVYESMTQTGASSPQAVTTDYQHQSSHGLYPDETNAGNNYYYPPSNQWNSASYDTSGGGNTSITIPPPYQLPPLQPPQPPMPTQAPPPTTAPARGRKDTSPAAAGTTNSGRPMRNKRTIAAVAAAAAAAAADDLNGGGYGSSSTGSNSRGAAKSRRKGSGGSNNSKGASMDRRDSVSNSGPIHKEAGNANASGAEKRAPGAKDDKNDGRWSKRFTWPDDLHRDFVSAIFDVGLKHSSPSSVMEQMPPHEQITTERIKSHLQKYRLHRAKSKKEFMTSYETSIAEMNKDGIDGVTALAGGQVAAHLTYASLNHPDPEPEESDDGGAVDDSDALGLSSPNREILAAQKSLSQIPSHDETPHEDVFVLPRLTEEEKQSPIGTSLGYLMGLFFSLKQQLDRQRQEQQEAVVVASQKQDHLQHPLLDHSGTQQDPRSAAAVFDSFTNELGVASKKSGASSTAIGAGAIAGTAIIPMSVPSTTRNLEENSMMKREMQSQMAFQNKMRALKQQELIKYNKTAAAAAATQSEHMLPPKKVTITTTTIMGASSTAPNTSFDSTGVQAAVELQQKLQQQDYQLAGESEGGDGTGGTSGGRERSASVAMEGEDDFWNTAVVDDELFDFLMSN